MFVLWHLRTESFQKPVKFRGDFQQRIVFLGIQLSIGHVLIREVHKQKHLLLLLYQIFSFICNLIFSFI